MMSCGQRRADHKCHPIVKPCQASPPSIIPHILRFSPKLVLLAVTFLNCPQLQAESFKSSRFQRAIRHRPSCLSQPMLVSPCWLHCNANTVKVDPEKLVSELSHASHGRRGKHTHHLGHSTLTPYSNKYSINELAKHQMPKEGTPADSVAQMIR